MEAAGVGTERAAYGGEHLSACGGGKWALRRTVELEP